MGFSLSWLAVQKMSPDRVCAALGLQRSGAFEEVPDSAITGAELPTGWYVVVMNDSPPAFDSNKELRRLSANGDAVACYVEEHGMVSGSVSWSRGHEQWRVAHDPAKGLDHLDVIGSAPHSLTSMLATAKRKQYDAGGADSEIDYVFDVPVDMACAATGYRHDRAESNGVPLRFELLIRGPGAGKPPWFSRLFRRRSSTS